MDGQSTKKSFGWGYLILGILLIITAIIAFRNPFSDVLALTMLFGIMAILSGIWFIVNNDGGNKVFRIIMGILDILIGIVLLFNLWAGAWAMPYVFAIWFIASSIYHIVLMVSMRQAYGNGYFWFLLIINILCIIAGVMLLFNPMASILTMSFILGFYFMLAGIESIVYAFTRNR